MSDLRKEFERLPEINEMLENNEYLKWCDKSGRYTNHRVFQDAETGFINGAWYAYREARK